MIFCRVSVDNLEKNILPAFHLPQYEEKLVCVCYRILNLCKQTAQIVFSNPPPPLSLFSQLFVYILSELTEKTKLLYSSLSFCGSLVYQRHVLYYRYNRGTRKLMQCRLCWVTFGISWEIGRGRLGVIATPSPSAGWGQAPFSKNLCTSLFNKYLSNEPNFGRIHLVGQYL